MALAVTFRAGPRLRRRGKQKVVSGTLAFDSSYPTGGEALTAASLGLAVIMDMDVGSGFGVVCAVETQLPATSVLVKAYWQNEVAASVLVEVTDTTSLAAVTRIPFTAYGR